MKINKLESGKILTCEVTEIPTFMLHPPSLDTGVLSPTISLTTFSDDGPPIGEFMNKDLHQQKAQITLFLLSISSIWKNSMIILPAVQDYGNSNLKAPL